MRQIYVFLLVGAAAGGAWAQGQKPAPPAAIDCRTCHTSDSPTKGKPSLVKCPRAQVKGIHSLEQAPRSLSLGQFADKFGPVPFSHRAHAEMAEMGGGCVLCHHYNEARPIQKCGECHSASRRREDLSRPDLKAALHRLCVDCHKSWSHDLSCGGCHAGKAFPTPTLPQRVVYRTESPAGKTVNFPHRDHARLLGLSCAGCHQAQTCASCHEVTTAATKAPAVVTRRARKTGSMEESHRRCFSCHADAQCASCHAQ